MNILMVEIAGIVNIELLPILKVEAIEGKVDFSLKIFNPMQDFCFLT